MMNQRLLTGLVVAGGMGYGVFALFSGYTLNAIIVWFAVVFVCVAAIITPEWFNEMPITWQTRRRDSLRANGGSYTPAEWQALCKSHGFCCVRCGKKRRLTADHIIPVSKGGSSYIENIQPLCMPCNSSKGVATVDYRSAVKAAARVQCQRCLGWFDSRSAYNGHLRSCK